MWVWEEVVLPGTLRYCLIQRRNGKGRPTRASWGSGFLGAITLFLWQNVPGLDAAKSGGDGIRMIREGCECGEGVLSNLQWGRQAAVMGRKQGPPAGAFVEWKM